MNNRYAQSFSCLAVTAGVCLAIPTVDDPGVDISSCFPVCCLYHTCILQKPPGYGGFCCGREVTAASAAAKILQEGMISASVFCLPLHESNKPDRLMISA